MFQGMGAMHAADINVLPFALPLYCCPFAASLRYSVMSLAASKRANELETALNAWEDNRLLTSGVVKLKQVRLIALDGWMGGADIMWTPVYQAFGNRSHMRVHCTALALSHCSYVTYPEVDSWWTTLLWSGFIQPAHPGWM